ncbi:MAG: 4'-phosphopantetheinyl transferase family protein [Spirulina sp.]
MSSAPRSRLNGNLPPPVPLDAAARVWSVNNAVVVVVPLGKVTPQSEWISSAEYVRAARIHHRRSRHQFLASRTLLRQWISQVTGQAANHLTLDTGPHGKPFLVEDPTLQFNLSHGGDWLMIVLSDRQAVGVDLEPIQPRRRLDQLCRRYLSEAESQSVLALPLDEATLQFLRYWTCKEAYVKGLGVGLTIPLNTVELTLPPNPQSTEPQCLESTQGLELGWRIYQWQPTPGYVAALALKGQA